MSGYIQAGLDEVQEQQAVIRQYVAVIAEVSATLEPPGLRMAAALHEVEESLERNLGAKKGGSPRSNSAGSRDASGRASTKSRSSKG